MTSINTLPYSSPPSSHLFTSSSASSSYPFKKFPQNSFSNKRRRSRPNKNGFSRNPIKPSLENNDYISINSNNQDLKLVLDINQISKSSSTKLTQFISSGEQAINDLKTLITLDENNRLVFSCQKSTLQFTGIVLLSGFLLVSSLRALIKLGLGFNRKFGARNPNFVVRRDRSLGGREVVVAVQDARKEEKRRPVNPVEIPGRVAGSGLNRSDWKRYRLRSQQKLPEWWPVSGLNPGRVVGLDLDEQYQREANRLIRAITNSRLRGEDVMEHDIIQLRRICRTSGVEASFSTTNTRDAFYRASIDFVLKVCSSSLGYSASADIDGENARQFIAGLAENIGLENSRAARMVSAAVAARTRSCFLQSWALEVQGKHSEAALELSKMCLVFQTFPPEESSPEMEMVARGLAKNLKVDQRELLMKMFVGVCSGDSHRTAADALGLVPSPERVGDQIDQ